ncbi:bifunctional adenosylcobinamide kinase/adenosylcobinamide-phosphate guanylyltransferase [Candidatus Reidiella endopervernicosa]|uniref:Bifunctional adenosylcobalamin biosynthesis protein n=1 Tax=Candidatus Reidiella endopervernicosa TaxID=2738883 RepID=A0A6N0I0Z8_9GAMM|nr:bifunctional adenosylcobinamide kinase/adenosylcobinamide-phosphate guanylyltransferase [Candidatus Reidiella endopervernicosa]QKQ28320.1 bifunctional adenosylcobinamide kinase/adenosylcobinamide-phosphate guanylyltransferase [Candidatus Reidiella endopervernicosa]
MVELILGGARSGKSALAEQRASEGGRQVIYIATAEAGDEEMAERIAHHRERRPEAWLSIEEPLALAAVLAENAAADRTVIVDCLTLWLSNLMAADEARLNDEREQLLRLLPSLPGRVVLVSNEVGLGIVPDNPLARRFRDEAGWLNQRVAEHAARVTFVAAGLPMILKGE